MGHAADANLTILSTQMVGFLSFPVQYWTPLISEKAEQNQRKDDRIHQIRSAESF